MRRVVVTGLGIVSSIGVGKDAVSQALRQAQSGIVLQPDYVERGFRSQVAGTIKIELEDHIDRRALRFMGPPAGYAYIAMQEALADSGLEETDYAENDRVGLVIGSGGPSMKWQTYAMETAAEKGVKRIGPFNVPKVMSSTCSAVLSTLFKIHGHNYSITSACSTSAHCIGHAAELIQFGKQDVVFAGGGEEEHWSLSMSFDAMGAMSSKYNDRPAEASRAFDKDRDGFVISAGGSVLVLEEYERAKARGAKIYAEIVGYGATSDGHDMVAPSGEGAIRCMRQALAGFDDRAVRASDVQYINAHGTSTPVGDVAELGAVKEVFGEGTTPAVGSTKSLTGHALGAAGSNESIYSLLMMDGGFLAQSPNIVELDEATAGVDILTEARELDVHTALSNSFGFGGTNASLIFSKALL
ncbi:MAG: beta-ketoacyl-[acyl-carrier-protein] synthase I [Rhodospirillaceae bacterium TMED140]|nr:beta-ketoacyl-[acyl-carrier-protein] synthase I [Rhodospirillaceae bacterium]OUX69048.1 MAG: beta-ketoacyl-[acyl-carrier-protein] synthase I [Rhodospirillaceae bacterium TMED140]